MSSFSIEGQAKPIVIEQPAVDIYPPSTDDESSSGGEISVYLFIFLLSLWLQRKVLYAENFSSNRK